MMLRIPLSGLALTLAVLARPTAAQQQTPQPAAGAATAATAVAAGAQPAGAWQPTPAANRPSMRGWTGDRRSFAVGDIITVLVDDYTISTAIKDDIAAQRRNRDLGFGADISPPGEGAGISADASIRSRNDADSRQRGEARRENRFQSEMSVRVVALGPNGTLQVRGARLVDVDKGKQNVALTGWVRAQDVSAANMVESTRIADAQLTYLSAGPLGKPKQGIVSRVIGLVWP
jgi:flagellar L-ring protein precursor FlgH